MTRTNPSRSRSAEASDGNADVYQVCSPPSSASTTARRQRLEGVHRDGDAPEQRQRRGAVLVDRHPRHRATIYHRYLHGQRGLAEAGWSGDEHHPDVPSPCDAVEDLLARDEAVGQRRHHAVVLMHAEDPGEFSRHIGRRAGRCWYRLPPRPETTQGVSGGSRAVQPHQSMHRKPGCCILGLVQEISCEEGDPPVVYGLVVPPAGRGAPPLSSTERHDDRRLEPWRRYVPCWRPWST